LGGNEPPLFGVALPLFAVGLMGLHARLERYSGQLGRIGVGLACMTVVSSLVLVLARVFRPDLIPIDEDSITPLTPMLVVAGFGHFVGLVFLGFASLRAKVIPSPWRALPLAMGLSGPLMMLLLITLSQILDAEAAIWERMIEVPIVLLGLAWMLLAYIIWPTVGAQGRSPKVPRRPGHAPKQSRSSDDQRSAHQADSRGV
jgi:hypothetical protein